MRIVLTLLSMAALIGCTYLNLGRFWLIVIQVISGIVILGCSISSEYAIDSLEWKNRSLSAENSSLSAEAEENRRNKERARRILGN